MNKHFLDKRRNVFLLAAFAVFMESLTSPCLKIGSQRYETFSIGYFFWFGLAVVILGIYAVCWQLILERIPLTTAYLRRGFSYILLFIWSMLIFHETITVRQIIGIAVISLGMIISVSEDSKDPPDTAVAPDAPETAGAENAKAAGAAQTAADTDAAAGPADSSEEAFAADAAASPDTPEAAGTPGSDRT